MKTNISIPWWFKILAKLILSRLPIGYHIWQKLGFFRHGYMDKFSYAMETFNKHISRAGLIENLGGKTILEMGPGDSIATVILAACYGAKAILIDVGSFANTKMDEYHELANALVCKGMFPPNISAANTISDILAACEARYLTQGLESFSSIETESVDFIFSQAVLEHVRGHEFLPTLRECFRVLKPEGIASHRIDLKDHLGGSLNNLRFSERVWESEFFASSGFYTNRIRFSEMITLFEEAGFRVEICHINRWKSLPLSKRVLSRPFQDLSDEELTISGFSCLLRKSIT